LASLSCTPMDNAHLDAPETAAAAATTKQMPHVDAVLRASLPRSRGPPSAPVAWVSVVCVSDSNQAGLWTALSTVGD